MVLSGKAKEAIKTGLAMTLAYGIALRMGWDKPMWAGLAVACVGLSSIGQSLTKGAMRILGTLVAGGVALVLIGIFNQNLWTFMLALSVWVSLCTYMSAGTNKSYFWSVSGFVCVIVALEGGTSSASAFSTAILRIQETTVGILSYNLVSLLLWPTSSYKAFHETVCQLSATQHQVYERYISGITVKDKKDDIHSLCQKLLQSQIQFNQLFEAAQADSYEVMETRQQWCRYRAVSAELTHALADMRKSFSEVHLLDHLRPSINDFIDEIGNRLDYANKTLAGTTIQRPINIVSLNLDASALCDYSHFQKAAISVMLSNLRLLDQLTQTLAESVNELKNPAIKPSVKSSLPRSRVILDQDRVMSVVRVLIAMWIALLCWVFIEGFPGGVGFVIMTASLAMAVSAMPQLPVTMLVKPAFLSILTSASLYIWVMPRLSGFYALGLLIFIVTFATCYLLASPRQGLARAFGLALFSAVAAISNQQTYSFLSVANMSLMFVFCFFVLAISSYIPFSPCPDKAFLRLLRRFFRSCKAQISMTCSEANSRNTALFEWRKDFYIFEVASLPQKLGVWLRFINFRTLPGSTPEHVQDVLNNQQEISYRMQALAKENVLPFTEGPVSELSKVAQAWYTKACHVFDKLSLDPINKGNNEDFSDLTKIMANVESKIKDVLDKTPEDELSHLDGEAYYRLLGVLHEMSEAVVAYNESIQKIDWIPWTEEVFP